MAPKSKSRLVEARRLFDFTLTASASATQIRRHSRRLCSPDHSLRMSWLPWCQVKREGSWARALGALGKASAQNGSRLSSFVNERASTLR